MRLSDVERYVGIEYCESTMDCADFCVLVQKELFGRDVYIPNGRPRGARGQVELGELSKPYGVPTDSPTDGDFVIMHGKLGGWHVGIYFHLCHEGYILHCAEEAKGSELTPVREIGSPIEGIYKWL